MNRMNPKVDNYIQEGCGRCPLVGTPECKVNRWRAELKQLRSILLDCGLNEELKWKIPCYTFENKNIVLMTAFNEYLALSFFKGALLKDPQGILVAQTENVQAARQVRFTDVQEIVAMETTLKAYIVEAIEVEKAGLKVAYKETAEFNIPEELQAKFDQMPAFKTAFEALTPGRQRAYLLYFGGAKQSKTRTARVEKYIPQILEGKGLNDDYSKQRK